jgi:hypothetical protein
MGLGLVIGRGSDRAKSDGEGRVSGVTATACFVDSYLQAQRLEGVRETNTHIALD